MKGTSIQGRPEIASEGYLVMGRYVDNIYVGGGYPITIPACIGGLRGFVSYYTLPTPLEVGALARS